MTELRQRFEKWADGKGCRITRIPAGSPLKGEYVSTATECYWIGWQAAQPTSEMVEEIARKIAHGSLGHEEEEYEWMLPILRNSLG